MRFMNWLRSEQSEFTFLVESQLPPSFLPFNARLSFSNNRLFPVFLDVRRQGGQR
ncbi:hypothetical protein GLUCOINTEAF2_0203757 [Komagataeibacter intermedius AF2]|uniref:Uncharacterized protein n=1 Tax=Komagataeibacter intermedius AF2 TaxID=1458464 RepID=A0A0N1FDD0_9PROT|nr:hypothetical protein GLUCOINTEAF2_0203757 [Komagataeibacter intermedius AF2]